MFALFLPPLEITGQQTVERADSNRTRLAPGAVPAVLRIQRNLASFLGLVVLRTGQKSSRACLGRRVVRS